MDNCIFCKIAAGTIPTKKIHEDADLIAFHDINPAAPVHLLIVPKQHIATLADCNDQHAAMLGKMLLLAPKLAREHGCGYLEAGDGGDVADVADGAVGSGGFKTLVNTGPDGGQEVYHLHMHVIGGPRPWRGQR
jgi:histidine triad (HIT) family protein